MQNKLDDGVGQIFTEDFFKKNPNIPKPNFKGKIKEKLDNIDSGKTKLPENQEEFVQQFLKGEMKDFRGMVLSLGKIAEKEMKEKIKQLDELEARLLTDAKGLTSDVMGAMTKYTKLVEARETLKEQVGNLQEKMKTVASGDLNEVMKIVLPQNEDKDRHQLETPFDMDLKRK